MTCHVQFLEYLLTDLPVELFGGRLINGVQKHLTYITRDTDGLDNPIQHGQRDEVLKVCELLDLFHRVAIYVSTNLLPLGLLP